MISRVASALHFLRPRTLAQLAKSHDDLRAEVRDLTRAIKEARKDFAQRDQAQLRALGQLQEHARTHAEMQERQAAAFESRLHAMNDALARVALHEQQLRAVARADVAFERSTSQLGTVLQDEAIARHARAAVEAAPLQLDPLPHCVVDNLLPEDFYQALIAALPPVELFGDRPLNKQQLMVPFVLAPEYSRRVWRYMSDSVAERMIAPPVLEKFREPVTSWLRQNFPVLQGDANPDVRMTTGDGRILLRTRGYRIPPHRDPKWGFITCLVYLVRPGDDERWGTQLFAVEDDAEAQNAKPHWIADAKCRLVKEVEFRRNRALIFLNSVGAHGAQIPADAEPKDLQRYVYQFRIGPQRRAMERLLATLPEERRQVWSGKVSDY